MTIEALAAAAARRAGATRQLKTLVYVADEQPVVAVVRGDQELNEAKLQTATGAQVVRPARPEEIPPLMGARAGSLGAVSFTRAKVFVDPSLAERRDMVTGANEDGFHLRGVDVRRDVLGHGTLAELRTVRAGEGCPRCDGHARRLQGARGRAHLQARHQVLGVDEGDRARRGGQAGAHRDGQLRHRRGADHGGGHRAAPDENGIVWPLSIAPFDVTVLTLGPEPELRQAAEGIVAALSEAGVEVLFDDRDERAGVKFKDADLIGIPLRIAVGKKGLAAGQVEWKLRRGGAVELVPVGEVAAPQGGGRALTGVAPRSSGGAPTVAGGARRHGPGRKEAGMRAKLSIGAEGQIVLPRRQAEALGLAGGGEADLVTARGAFALDHAGPRRGAGGLVRRLAGRAQRPRGGAVRGHLAQDRRAAPLLRPRGGAAAAAISPICFAGRASTFATGRWCTRRRRIRPTGSGRCSWRPAPLEADLARCRPLVGAGRALGQVLVDEGILTAGQVYEGMTLQVREILLAALLEDGGDVRLPGGAGDEPGAVQLRERTRDLLLEGMRRLDEAARLAQELGGREAVLVPTGRPARPGCPTRRASSPRSTASER